jgi:hypothetical protein
MGASSATPFLAGVTCRWLGVGRDPLEERLHDAVRLAHADIGEVELPGNRGAYCDRVNTRFGSPLGSPYCANSFGGWWKDAGLWVPVHEVGSCDVWWESAKIRNCFLPDDDPRWRELVRPGWGVLYGVPGNAGHVGILARKDRGLWTIEANTSAYKYDREGRAVLFKPLEEPSLLGFITPQPIT